MIDPLSSLFSRTMLIERLLGIAAYDLCVALTYFLLNSCNSKKALKIVLRTCCLMLVILAFFFVPDSSKDLYRWLQISNDWPSLGLKSFIFNVAMKSNTPVAYFMMYACRLTGFDGTLPAFCAFIFYTNAFHVLLASYQKLQASSKDISLAFIFLMCTGSFLEVISGVRCFVAFSIIARCFFDEFIEKRSIAKSIPLYLVAALIHLAVLPVLAIRLGYLIFIELSLYKNNSLINLIMVSLFLIVFLYEGSSIIQASIAKAKSYLTSRHYSYTWEYIIGILKYSLVGYIIHKGRCDAHLDNDISLMNLMSVNKIYIIVALLLFFEYNTFHRLAIPIDILSIPIVSTTSKTIKDPDRASFRTCIIVSCALILALASARGNLCGYKFFVL